MMSNDDLKKGAWTPEEVRRGREGPCVERPARECEGPGRLMIALPRPHCWTTWHMCPQDLLLKRLVDQLGPARWSIVAERIPGRSGKSCRLR